MIKVGDLVRYDPNMFKDPTLTETHSLPFGWLRDDFEGTEPDWIGVVKKVDPTMWGKSGGMGYEVVWSHGYVEMVYAFEIKKVLDSPQGS